MGNIQLFLIALLIISTTVFLTLYIREWSLLKRILCDISERRNEGEKYPKKIYRYMEGYLTRYKLRDQAYEEARMSAHESERGAARLSRNIQKALIYSSDISAETERNRNVASTLSSNVSEGSAAVEEINASIRSLKNKMDTQNDAINHTSDAIANINGSLKDVAEMISKRRKDTDSLVHITNDGSEKVQASAEVMQKVQNEVSDALSLITVIDEIASQTNLLSMNAAIEAAHAGDSGKGFAVVAEEIRKLAESTAENARNISKTLKELVNNIEKAGELSLESERAFNHIAEGVSAVSGTFAQINEKTESLFHYTQNVVSSTVSLKEISAVTSLSMREMEVGATEIENILINSKNIAEQLDSSMTDLSRNSRDINLISFQISKAFMKSNETLNAMVEKILTNQKGITQSTSRVKMTNVILSHVSWVASVRGLIDGTITPDEFKGIDARSCELGIWINENGAEAISDKTKLANLKENHNLIHQKTARILSTINSSTRVELEEIYSSVQDISEKIIQILTTLGYNDGLQWTESISVKIDLFDGHHKKLIDLINKLFHAMEKGEGNSMLVSIVEELLQYTEYHFSAEEKVFQKYDYPDREAHMAQHRTFVAKAKEIARGMIDGSTVLTNDILDFLQDWVVNHIMKVDRKYSEFLSDKEI